uniref:C2H2-type domain-containing protein n=1 Tax=Candidatus Nitrotoga fabula TaxID=2182327 RepID=A0A2X0SGZ2_9PROT|nr:conserved protein of unknown function [Candidatus Nitrotoga fabula]
MIKMNAGNYKRSHTKTTVEECTTLDVNRWAREGYLTTGRSFNWEWTWGNGNRSSINVHVESTEAIRLVYRARACGEVKWSDVDYRIYLERTPCRFGGIRSWFLCHECGRRVTKLYCSEHHYVCRHCGDLAYKSQRENRDTRTLRRAQAIRIKLGGSTNMLESFPSKPKGMHWSTYERLWTEARQLEHKFNICLANKFGNNEIPFLKAVL